MRVSELAYELPEDLIAQEPAPRGTSRMMILRGATPLQHCHVQELPTELPKGALIVLNDTRVLHARLLGHRVPTGGKVEIFLLRRHSACAGGEIWHAMGRASKALRVGTEILVERDDCSLHVMILEQQGAGELLVRVDPGDGTLEALLPRVGHVPLPPYIRRPDSEADRERYQTVFAKRPGAVAAPTAGLHLTDALLARLRESAEVCAVTLHVGLGTFQPVTADELNEHPMHREWYCIPAGTAESVRRAKRDGRPVVAVGTTVVRALESASAANGELQPGEGETDLLIQPGYCFRVADWLFTNYHLPKSTLLALVCAFAGKDRVLSAYALAIQERYRFFSYGDCMLIEREGT